MKILYPALLAFSIAALTACANDANTNASAATGVTPGPASAASVATSPAAPAEATGAVAAPATTDAMAGMSAKEHAEMANKTSASGQPAPAATGVQAGWYTAGIFRACGSTQAMKVDKPGAIDAQIKKGGMSAGDPVYVQLEGMPMGDSYMLTRVTQVGSKAPVRDCPMTGTTTQSGD